MTDANENKSLETAVWTEIATVEDPEIGLPLTELGLIYGVEISDDDKVRVEMTLTSMACPYGPQLTAGVHAAAGRVAGVSDVHVEVVWSPAWDPHEMATEDAKITLGIA